MSGLHPMASIETRAPSRSMRFTSAGIAVISLDFSSVASWPSTKRSIVANADTKCRAFCPRLWSWLRREVLPSMATRSGLSGQHSATHDEKQAANSSGSIRFITVRKPIGARDTVVELREAPQERQMRFAPIDDVLIVVPHTTQEQNL